MKTISKTMLALGIAAGLVAVAGGVVMYSGAYNVAADAPHTPPVYALLETARERSIATRAADLTLPADLNDPARITQGAGNYNAMCTGCHLTPGMAETELSKGLYPAPPNLSKESVDAAEAFWVIKHGIKASGMPAWGKSMSDEYIWNMAAFLQLLPKLDAAQYKAMVASSGGHSHGGGETQPHAHADGVSDDHGDESMEGTSAPHAHPPGTPAHEDKPTAPHAGMDMTNKAAGESKPHAHPPGTPADHHKTTVPAKLEPEPTTGMVEHRHADGTIESHPAPQPAKADDGHDHEH